MKANISRIEAKEGFVEVVLAIHYPTTPYTPDIPKHQQGEEWAKERMEKYANDRVEFLILMKEIESLRLGLAELIQEGI